MYNEIKKGNKLKKIRNHIGNVIPQWQMHVVPHIFFGFQVR